MVGLGRKGRKEEEHFVGSGAVVVVVVMVVDYEQWPYQKWIYLTRQCLFKMGYEQNPWPTSSHFLNAQLLFHHCFYLFFI